MKKNIIKIAVLALAIVMLSVSLVSCSKLGGTYTMTDSTGTTSYTFSFWSDKVVWNYLGYPIEGTYKIDGDKITFNFIEGVWENDERSFRKEGKSIFLNDVEYVKE